MRTRSEIRAVYKNTHADYRIKTKDGTLMIMYYDNGTILGPVETLPEDIWKEKLEKAIEARKHG